MRLVLDTNIFISALITTGSLPDKLYRAWEAQRFSLITSRQQLAELYRVVQYPRLAPYFHPAQAEVLLQGISHSALVLEVLPAISCSPDPDDDVILATAIAGGADYLVSGDKKGLLLLGEVEGIPIVTVRAALDILA